MSQKSPGRMEAAILADPPQARVELYEAVTLCHTPSISVAPTDLTQRQVLPTSDSDV
jgi:hypothetical protein